MTALTQQARILLDGDTTLGNQTIRAACWLARLALEDAISQALMVKGLQPGSASMRSLLSCLESAYCEDDPELVARAEYAWSGLSKAAHYHAFELSPTVSEARNLLAIVEDLPMPT
jgi:hypothetical protein